MDERLAGVYVISGIAGAGKTTVAQELALHFEKAAVIENDALLGMIARGRVPPGHEPGHEAERQFELRTRLFATVADCFFDAGFVPILHESLVTRRQLNSLVELLRSRPLLLVVLDVSPEVASQRERQQGRAHGAQWPHLDATLRQEMSGTGLWLDAETLSPAELASAVVQRADPEAVVSR